jgi:pyruvate,water dikinase
VRVITDPGEVDTLNPGDVLVCRTTDPSWGPLFFIASALVIDIGGAMSHGAIIARELGLPCVIGTETGTTTLTDGQLILVDGDTGVVRVR